MEKIQSKEEALVWMAEASIPTIDFEDFADIVDALVDFFLTDEQKKAMQNAQYKYALQIGIDPDFAKFYYYAKETE